MLSRFGLVNEYSPLLLTAVILIVVILRAGAENLRELLRPRLRLLGIALGASVLIAGAAGTAIYYLLTDERDSFSAMHRLPADEV